MIPVSSTSPHARTALCFVLANPRPETPVAALARRLRWLASRLPVVGRRITPRWSPARRMGFAAGLRACVQSIRRLHANIPPIVLLTPAGQGPILADVDEVISFDPAPYASIPCRELYGGREVFYKLELFNRAGFERIIYFDCDTLVVDDISPLWDPTRFTERPFWGVREGAEMGVDPSVFGKFNTGVMIVNRPLMNDAVYGRLLELARSGVSYDGGDQGVINAYLDERGGDVAGDLDSGYNVLVRARKLGDWEVLRTRLKVLHFVNALKPWAANHRHDWLFDEEFKRLWDEAYRFAPGELTAPDLQPPGAAR